MSEQATIFELPYNLFLMNRMEFVVICGDQLAANIMRIVEAEMIKRKEAWQVRAEKAIEEKKPLPKEPKTFWARLSQAQIIARLYMYDSAKLKKPESEDLGCPEWVEYRFKKGLSISKATLKKAIDLLKALGFLIERSKPGDEFGAPIYTLSKEDIQAAIKKLPANPFAIFHALGGVENFDSGGDSKIFHVPPENSDSGESKILTVPPEKFSPGESQNFRVDIDITIDHPEDSGIDTEEEGTYSDDGQSATSDANASTSAPASQFVFQIQGAERFYYHDFCIHEGDRGINDQFTLIVKNLSSIPQDAECSICYKPIHGPHGYWELPELTDEPYVPDFSAPQAPAIRELSPVVDEAIEHVDEQPVSTSEQDSVADENETHSQLSTCTVEKPRQASAKVEPRRSRKPTPPKVDQADVETYLAVFDELYLEVAPDGGGYGHTAVDRKAIVDDLLKPALANPKFVTPDKLRRVYRSLYKKPKDEKTGFCWAENMSIKAVCRNYAKEAMILTTQARTKAKEASTLVGVSGKRKFV